MVPIQEHAIIMKATRDGISEERIAKVLKVDVASIRQKQDLLYGICKEAAEILKNKHLSKEAFSFLRKMKSMRQVEVVELLAATANFTVPYVKALLDAIRPDMLADHNKQLLHEIHRVGLRWISSL